MGKQRGGVYLHREKLSQLRGNQKRSSRGTGSHRKFFENDFFLQRFSTEPEGVGRDLVPSYSYVWITDFGKDEDEGLGEDSGEVVKVFRGNAAGRRCWVWSVRYLRFATS